MSKLIVDSFLYDVGQLHGSADAMVENIIARTMDSWSSGADLVLFPEYCWANLLWYSTPHLTLTDLADLFWSKYWPRLARELSLPDKAVILGSVPFKHRNVLRNRSPMLIAGQELFQDKLCLTPWEAHLDGGEEIRIFEFKGAKIANLVCLDSEIPATGDILKQNGPLDLLVVPSATESLMGVERIARCSSARAVELGAAVIVSQLVGGIDDEFIGNNIGQNSLYLPSLTATKDVIRIDERGVEASGTKVDRFEVDLELLAEARQNLRTTNPALIRTSKKLFVKK